MPLIGEIRKKIETDQFEFSKHAVDQSIIRRISVQEVREVFASAEVIEDYPENKYGPSCLIFGRTTAGRPLYIQCSYPSRPLIKIITLLRQIRHAGSISRHGGHDEHERRETG